MDTEKNNDHKRKLGHNYQNDGLQIDNPFPSRYNHFC